MNQERPKRSDAGCGLAKELVIEADKDGLDPVGRDGWTYWTAGTEYGEDALLELAALVEKASA